MALKKGDKVVMHSCYEAQKYSERVWTVKSNPWIIGVTPCVLLEGFSGGFAVEYLKHVDTQEDGRT